ncbi:MAG: signal recognition particle subunit SRP19/SEC65 family protein [Candidatus Bathyarchaeia archaeon]|jgi:signal recognition particle subunit SRP19|nr:signal recognition particle protein Srp19 [Candidatus Bathyarchaeota archaeon A05DMB-4]MDH7594510.1 signal recognition particle subunit SRP19/SEC65 family protein [Candidatus Bathyarchaeota archaeon]
MRKQERFIIWPAYFDQSRTRSEGRKISKNIALPAPKLEELQKVAERLGLSPEIVAEASHPAAHWLKTGAIMVSKKGSKLQILRKMAKELAVLRAKT